MKTATTTAPQTTLTLNSVDQDRDGDFAMWLDTSDGAELLVPVSVTLSQFERGEVVEVQPDDYKVWWGRCGLSVDAVREFIRANESAVFTAAADAYAYRCAQGCW